MGRRYRLSEKTKRFFLITLLLTPACYQIMPEIRMALVLAAMGEAVLSADRIWARNESFPFANLYDDRNPLYVRKMLKKRKCFSGINGYFVVQILLLSYVLLMTAGFISDHIIHRRYQEIRLEFFWIYWGIIMSLGVVEAYYIHIYKKSFCYPRNKKGIWMPFSFIGYEMQGLAGRILPDPTEETEKNQPLVFEECLFKSGYAKKANYILKENDQICFYQKRKNQQVNLWAIIDIADMKKMHIQLLNDAFEIFWCNELTREEKKKDVRFTFVIQTERINDAIGRIFYDGSGIRMYKHRSRMAVLYEKKHDIIKIKCTDRESRYKNIYREMREELKRVIGRRDIDR